MRRLLGPLSGWVGFFTAWTVQQTPVVGCRLNGLQPEDCEDHVAQTHWQRRQQTRERGSVDTYTASGMFSNGNRRGNSLLTCLVTQEHCTSHDVTLSRSRLQQFYDRQVFASEAQEYAAEGLKRNDDWSKLNVAYGLLALSLLHGTMVLWTTAATLENHHRPVRGARGLATLLRIHSPST